MLQLTNTTPFAGQLALMPDVSGVDTLYTIVKGTFTIGERVAVAEKQMPVVLADAHYGEPANTSIRVPSDLCLGKLGTDVLLIGSAWAPHGRPTWQMDVSVSVGSLSRTLRVNADRRWEDRGAGATMTWVEPFDRMPLVWERAFGGTDETEKGPHSDPRNPAGVGFRVRGGSKDLAGSAVPNLEDPAAPITGAGDAPAPACFAPIASHWEPRRSFAGTYDEAWQKARAPYLPADFDRRFFQLAPAGLVASSYLEGGEPVELQGLTPTGLLCFALPKLAMRVAHRLDGAEQEQLAVLDTVIVESDTALLKMVWRSVFPCDKRALKVREVIVRIDAAEGLH